jgi:phosphate starvation-inducible PhoH-like protein
MATLVGPLDEHLHLIASHLQVTVQRRGSKVRITGNNDAAQAAALTLSTLVQRLPAVDPQAVHLALIEHRPAPGTPPQAASDVTLMTRRSDVSGRTPNQKRYITSIQRHDLTFALGPAGTGKTFLAVACAVDALERALVQRIVLTRPAVEAGERLGFLPGDLSQKVDPYLRPLYDALHDLMGFDRVAKAFERHSIEIAPLAYMRGRTLNDAFVILDEAQNTTPEQMKMFLTRMGFGSKMVVTGDPSQIDLPRGQHSGLAQARQILEGTDGIAFCHFDGSDIVRHPMVARIVKAYDSAQQQARPDLSR